jgi:phosphoglycolate phosphatase
MWYTKSKSAGRQEMKLKTYHRILWDFNGTILDDMDLCLSCINTMLAARGIPCLADLDAYRKVFGFPVQIYYARVGLEGEGDGFVRDAHEWMALYRAKEKDLTVRKGAEDALAFISKLGVPQGILSATETSMLMSQLEGLGLSHYFDQLFGRDDIYAADKSQIAKRYRDMHPHERVLMIGDTLHDYETAVAGGFDCVLVLGGHQNRETLVESGVPVLENFEELIAYLSK